MNRPKRLAGALLVSALAIGCVSQNSYDAVVAEKDGFTQELATTQQDLTRTTVELERSSDTLKNTSANLTLMTGERDLLTRQLDQTSQTLITRTTDRNTLQSNLEATTTELNNIERILNDALDDLDHAQQNNLTITGQLKSRTAALATATASLTEIRALHDSLQTETGISTKYKKVAESYLSGLRQTMAFVTNQISGSELVDVITPVTIAVALTEDQGLIDAWQKWLDAPFGTTAELLAEIGFVDVLMQRLRDNGPNPS